MDTARVAARFLAGTLFLLLASVAQAVVPPFPTITGPVPNPDPVLGPMFPGIRPSLTPGHDLADFGYVTEEYWVSGLACSAAYRTRIVIRRPSDMSKFSGVVVAEPLHRGGNALIMNFARYGILQRGHIGLEVDARSINLNNANNPLQSLQPFNAARYGTFVLAANNNAQANEILAQVGRLIKTLTEPSNPLKNWPIQRIVMGGTSDSSGAVLSYIAGSTGTGCTGSVGHTTFRMPDDGPIYDGFFRGSILNTTPSPILADVPQIEMPTQFELNSSSGFRKADSDAPDNRYRLFEMSGSSHNDTRDNAGFEPSQPGGQTCDGYFEADGVTRTPFDQNSLSRFDFNATYFMGLQHLIDWTFGIVPPTAARMDFHSTPASCSFDGLVGLSTRVGLDPASMCLARNGVRSTYLDVPLFNYKIPNTGPGSLCNQTSHQFRFSDSTITSLHLNPRNYANKWKRRLGQLMGEGWVYPEYADDIRSDAKVFWDNGPESIFWRKADGSNAVWYMNGAALASSTLLPDAHRSWNVAGTGDFNGDGQIDILFQKADGSMVMWLVAGGAVTATASLPSPGKGWEVAGIGDFDGDGRADIFLRRGADGANAVRLMNGGTVVASASLPRLDKHWSVVGVGDFDGDGKSDIVFSDRRGSNVVWFMDGTVLGSAADLAVPESGWSIAAIADFDGDGKADLLLRKGNGRNAVSLMNGADAVSTTHLPSFGHGWTFAASADYDGDGKDDLLIRRHDGSNVIWFMNGKTVRSATAIASFPASWKAVGSDQPDEEKDHNHDHGHDHDRGHDHDGDRHH